ncbi:unnamed protein product [Candidula unifasciata]|uniref:COX assembly mitochondrial protein n=1 Tax=Candidula unifasciata TaxID=100452 RepID=A0A8S3Z1R0_9EUPU|nr:unnamed protein product [Candidula unifasciata]
MAARIGHDRNDDGVLPSSVSGGPHGVGDPDDRTLRKVEREIMIPLKMKEKAKVLKCPDEVKDFGECARCQGVMMPFKCRKEAASLKLCLASAYQDPTFVELCTQEYLDERTEYRRTGIKRKEKKTVS